MSLKISENLSIEWKNKVELQYSNENRYYHNVVMLERKMELIGDMIENESLRNSLILASIFQYYHFDAKRNRRDENCDEFRLFVNEAEVKDVSNTIHLLSWYLKIFKYFSPR